jgi:hypothetical protein
MRYLISGTVWFLASGLLAIYATTLGKFKFPFMTVLGCFFLSGIFANALFIWKNNFKIYRKFSWIVIGLVTPIITIFVLSVAGFIIYGSFTINIKDSWLLIKLLIIPAMLTSFLAVLLNKLTLRA